jgi:octaprenyl-diphosphate synthase
LSVDKLAKLVEPEMQAVNARILEACKNEAELIPTVASHLIAAGGKRLRPMLTLAAAKLCGYEGARHVNLAASVEFMHTATLLHDDVVDESNKRRGMATANFIWGNKASVLVGDYLLGKAFQMMTSDGSIEVLRVLSDAAARIAEGEVMQLSTTNNINTSYAQYIEVIKAKTAELFAAATEVGGVICSKHQKELRSFGENFGIAFQIIDDALDYSANPEKFGKTIGDDFREGKVTLPVIYAFERGDKAAREFWREIIEGKKEYSPDALATAGRLILESGAFASSVECAKKYAEEAKKALDCFKSSDIKLALLEVVDFCVNREF